MIGIYYEEAYFSGTNSTANRQTKEDWSFVLAITCIVIGIEFFPNFLFLF